MIRDTSSQDAVLTAPKGHAFKRRAPWIAGAAAVIVVAGLLVSSWRGSEHSVSASRLRIAEVAHLQCGFGAGGAIHETPGHQRWR